MVEHGHASVEKPERSANFARTLGQIWGLPLGIGFGLGLLAGMFALAVLVSL